MNHDYAGAVATAQQVHGRKHDGAAMVHFYAAAAWSAQEQNVPQAQQELLTCCARILNRRQLCRLSKSWRISRKDRSVTQRVQLSADAGSESLLYRCAVTQLLPGPCNYPSASASSAGGERELADRRSRSGTGNAVVLRHEIQPPRCRPRSRYRGRRRSATQAPRRQQSTTG